MGQRTIDNSDKLEALRNALHEAEANGTKEVAVDRVVAAIDELQQEHLPYEARLEMWKADFEASLHSYQAASEQQRDGFRSVITFGQGAMKAVMVTNGGAALAMLAFAGQAAVQGMVLDGVVQAIRWFAAGVLCAAAAPCAAYLAQCAYFGPKKSEKQGRFWRAVAITLVFVGLGLFLYGAWTASTGILDLVEHASSHRAVPPGD